MRRERCCQPCRGWLCTGTRLCTGTQLSCAPSSPCPVRAALGCEDEQKGGSNSACAPAEPAAREQTPSKKARGEPGPGRVQWQPPLLEMAEEKTGEKEERGEKCCSECSVLVIWRILPAGTVTPSVTNFHLLFHMGLLNA